MHIRAKYFWKIADVFGKCRGTERKCLETERLGNEGDRACDEQ